MLQHKLQAHILNAAKPGYKILFKDTNTLYCKKAAHKLSTISLLARTYNNNVGNDTIDILALYSLAHDKINLQNTNSETYQYFVTTLIVYHPNDYNIVLQDQVPAITRRVHDLNNTGVQALAAIAANLPYLATNNNVDSDDIETTPADITDITDININITSVVVSYKLKYTNRVSRQTVINFENPFYLLLATSWVPCTDKHNSKMLYIKLKNFAKQRMKSNATDNTARLPLSTLTLDPQTLRVIRHHTKTLFASPTILQWKTKCLALHVTRSDTFYRRTSVPRLI
jgi:hypothetical protein